MPNYQGVWSLSTQYQNAGIWPVIYGGDIGALQLGSSGGAVSSIDYINIATSGNATSYGNLSAALVKMSSFSSATQGFFAGGELPYTAGIEFLTFRSGGTTSSFGSLSVASRLGTGASNSTRGLVALGFSGSSRLTTIDYITMASAGDAQDFGDLTVARYGVMGGSSTTRALFAGGNSSGGKTNVTDYVTIASTGNALDFGDLTVSVDLGATNGVCSSTRFVRMGGRLSSGQTNTIDYFTIASTGNATDFGDLLFTLGEAPSGVSNSVTGLCCGGQSFTDGNSGQVNTIQSVTIASTGNASDFGDLTVIASSSSACSNSHGGLS